MYSTNIAITFDRNHFRSLSQCINKAKALYKERYLQYVRVAMDDGKAFFLAKCAAEMKKHLFYEVDIKMDENGAILECQCECAVGAAPDAHCKHRWNSDQ